MQICRIEEARLGAVDAEAISALLGSCFGTDFGGRSFYQQRHHVRLVARDPEIVGHLALCLRAIRMGEALVDMVGLAEVCTLPERRGEGIAGALLKAAVEEARATGADFFVLFGDRPLYAAAGFEVQRNVLRYVEMEGARTDAVKVGRKGGLMVLKLGDRDWDAGAEIDLLGHLF